MSEEYIADEKYKIGQEVYWFIVFDIKEPVNLYKGTVIEYTDGRYRIQDVYHNAQLVEEECIAITEKEISDKALQYIEKLKKKKREALALKLGEHLLSILEIYKDEVE